MKTNKLMLFTLIACSLAACDMFSSDLFITITLPELPVHWVARFPDLSYTIEYPKAGGGIDTLHGDTWASGITIRIPKRINTPVLCIPKANGTELYPCGSIFPVCGSMDGCKENLFPLSWENGFVAEILITLVERGYDTSTINVEKLLQTVETKAKDDPWTLDKNQLMERLVSGKFSTYCIDPLPTATIDLSPVSGEWFSTSPFTGVISAGEDCTLKIENVVLGFHRFVSVTTSSILDVTINEKETLWIMYERQ